jgi:hypothetical protein
MTTGIEAIGNLLPWLQASGQYVDILVYEDRSVTSVPGSYQAPLAA